jgi:DNA adenine methylase
MRLVSKAFKAVSVEKFMAPTNPPHPIPYQGSKRWIAQTICECLPSDTQVFFEPFAGSAAISLAAAKWELAASFVINDIHSPLMDLWNCIIESPETLADGYEALWRKQQEDGDKDFFNEVRRRFNQKAEPALFLYLLARCVKAAIRYNTKGEFNNTADHRRAGARPETMRQNIFRASQIFQGKTTVKCGNYLDALCDAGPLDVIYMDPPYQGTSKERDARYVRGLSYEAFCSGLQTLSQRGLSYIVSYDGRTGERSHGKLLPDSLGLTHVEVEAGRSTQETLLGRSGVTFESVYLSQPLLDRIGGLPRQFAPRHSTSEQTLLF